MSVILTALLLIFILILISQFGGKLNAKNSVGWWLIFAFILFCTVQPDTLAPIAHFLGIQLVSNLVMSSLIVLLMFLAIQESALTTSLLRRLRDSVTSQAANEYCDRLEKQRKSTEYKKVLVVLPAYNEEAALPAMIDRIQAFPAHSQFQFEFCFVSDGSLDGSEAILRERLPDGFVSHSANVGVAGVILTAFKILKRAQFEYVVQCDSDGQHPLERIHHLVEEAEKNKADLLIGSRYLTFKTFQKHKSSTYGRRMGSVMIGWALRLFSFHTKISDPTSGFRVYSRDAALFLLKHMPDEYPEPESVALLMTAGKRVLEIPVEMLPRQGGVSSLSGIKSAQFMIKVMSALLGLRMRSW